MAQDFYFLLGGFQSFKSLSLSPSLLQFYLNQVESMDLDTFLTSGWQMMRPTYKMDQRMFIPPTTEAPIEGLAPPPVPETEAKVRGQRFFFFVVFVLSFSMMDLFT